MRGYIIISKIPMSIVSNTRGLIVGINLIFHPNCSLQLTTITIPHTRSSLFTESTCRCTHCTGEFVTLYIGFHRKYGLTLSSAATYRRSIALVINICNTNRQHTIKILHSQRLNDQSPSTCVYIHALRPTSLRLTIILTGLHEFVESPSVEE